MQDILAKSKRAHRSSAQKRGELESILSRSAAKRFSLFVGANKKDGDHSQADLANAEVCNRPEEMLQAILASLHYESEALFVLVESRELLKHVQQ